MGISNRVASCSAAGVGRGEMRNRDERLARERRESGGGDEKNKTRPN